MPSIQFHAHPPHHPSIHSLLHRASRSIKSRRPTSLAHSKHKWEAGELFKSLQTVQGVPQSSADTHLEETKSPFKSDLFLLSHRSRTRWLIRSVGPNAADWKSVWHSCSHDGGELTAFALSTQETSRKLRVGLIRCSYTRLREWEGDLMDGLQLTFLLLLLLQCWVRLLTRWLSNSLLEPPSTRTHKITV